ncbi:hypothetical protein GDO81_024630 [Engystomops pustulosus]|uniref:Uncharacterized protein n=1 Tax=Engystomops pustulosus TaxID=76066 RepID=A0AAV6ZB09_ENGPU|nr:hypothetical protein GDO81_024630 [Engystomops pustulosus]
MASAGLGKELECSICLSLYTDPVTLRCGHNFCRVCIDQVLTTQDGSGGYSCPECREEFQGRPGLQRNVTLCNIVENFLSFQPHQEDFTQICCTYCIQSPVPAVNLTIDEDTGGHDGGDGDTGGHDGGDEDTGRHDGGDEDTGGHDGGDGDTGGHDGGDEDTGGHDGGDEDTGRHDGGDEDTGGHDGGDGDTGGHDGGDEDTGRHDGGDEDTGGQDVDVDVITRMLHAVRTPGIGGKITAIEAQRIYGEGPADILLDVNTVANNMYISDDLKTATCTLIRQNHPERAERFQYSQVINHRRFTSGRHYWDVEVSRLGLWRVGMCYPSIDRTGHQSYIGDNNKSWCLSRWLSFSNQYSVIHDGEVIPLPHQISSDRFRISLDYEAGKLSFYELCDPIRHLHTFTTTFTEPLHAALSIYIGFIKILGE